MSLRLEGHQPSQQRHLLATLYYAHFPEGCAKGQLWILKTTSRIGALKSLSVGQKSSLTSYVSVCALEITEIIGGGGNSLPLERQPPYLKIEKGTILHFNLTRIFMSQRK